MSWWWKSQRRHYEDVESSIEERGNSFHQLLSISTRRYITDWACDVKAFIFHSCKHWLSWVSSLAHVCILAPRLASSNDIACLKIVHQDFNTCVSKFIFVVACNGRNMRLGSKQTRFLWFLRWQERSCLEDSISF